MCGCATDVSVAHGNKNAIVISGNMLGKEWHKYIEYMEEFEKKEGIRCKPGKGHIGVPNGNMTFIFADEVVARKAMFFIAEKFCGFN